MKHLHHEKQWLALTITVVVLLATVFVISVVRNLSQADPEPATQETSQTQTSAEDDFAQESIESKEVETPSIDPETLSTITIEPLNITVSYVSGIPGFQYAIKRTQNSTQYVEFSASELVGSKCTDDTGAFASIIVSPAGEDAATIAQSVVVDGETYGLSLPDDTCTGDQTLFMQYQDAFGDAFGFLKKA